MKWFTEIVQGFEERMNNIAVFAPLLNLQQKTKYPYHLPSLSLAVMLFILEDMLRGEKNCTYENVAYFLKDLINRQYQDDLSYEEALNFTYYLVREGLMNNGRPQAFTYVDLETGAEKAYKFHLIELDEYDLQDKSVRLKLSTVGLELLFKTKEMYNELQVSITQLYLRQQIQKGVFDGALRSVEELSLAVKNEKAKIRELEERIIRDVLQVAREKELEKQMQRVNEQLERERRVFKELEELIEQTMQEYHSGAIGEKESQAIEKILKVKRKLLQVIHQHESLFTDKILVQKLMNKSLETMILTAFNTKVNFETEFLRPIVRKNLGIDVLKKLLDPLLPVKRPQFFHPGRVFMEQPLKREGDAEPDQQELLELEEEMLRQQEEKERQLQIEKERHLESHLLLLLKPLVKHEEIRISKLLEDLRRDQKETYDKLVGRMEFYALLVQLHQLGVIPLLNSWETGAVMLDDLPRVLVKISDENEEIHRLKGFELVPEHEVIHLPSGYVMSDFKVRRRVPDGMA